MVQGGGASAHTDRSDRPVPRPRPHLKCSSRPRRGYGREVQNRLVTSPDARGRNRPAPPPALSQHHPEHLRTHHPRTHRLRRPSPRDRRRLRRGGGSTHRRGGAGSFRGDRRHRCVRFRLGVRVRFDAVRGRRARVLAGRSGPCAVRRSPQRRQGAAARQADRLRHSRLLAAPRQPAERPEDPRRRVRPGPRGRREEDRVDRALGRLRQRHPEARDPVEGRWARARREGPRPEGSRPRRSPRGPARWRHPGFGLGVAARHGRRGSGVRRHGRQPARSEAARRAAHRPVAARLGAGRRPHRRRAADRDHGALGRLRRAGPGVLTSSRDSPSATGRR